MWYSRGVERERASTQNIVNINKHKMIVSELIAKLQQLPPDKEVKITDGYETKCYEGDFYVGLFSDGDDSFVDIGIGGCEIE